MDPLTLTTACIGALSSIGSLFRELIKFVGEFREARRDVDGVRREVTSLQLCVESLQADLQNDQVQYPAHLQESLKQVLIESDNVITEIIALVQKVLVGGTGRRLAWSLSGQSEMQKLRSRLESHKATLDLALDLMNIIILQSVKEDTAAIATQNVEIKEDSNLIKNNTDEIQIQLTNLIAEFKSLKFRLEEKRHSQALEGRQHVLQRFLDDSTQYAETVIEDDIISNPDLLQYEFDPIPRRFPAEEPRYQPEAVSPSDLVLLARRARSKLSHLESIDLDLKFGNHFIETPSLKGTKEMDARVFRLKELLNAGADANLSLPKGVTPFGVYDYWSYWLPKQVIKDVNSPKFFRFRTPLVATILKFPERLDLIELPINFGADVNARQKSSWGSHDKFLEFEYPLHAAAAVTRHKVARLLVQYGADPNVQGGLFGTALCVASFTGQITTIELLLHSGAKVDLGSEILGTPLTMAAQSRSALVVRLLLSRGADVHTKSGIWASTLITASTANSWVGSTEQVMNSLLDAGADVNVRAINCYTTPVLRLCRSLIELYSGDSYLGSEYTNCERLLDLLIRRGANLNLIYPDTGTLLHQLIWCRFPERAHKARKMIIEAGADCNIRADFKSSGSCTVIEWVIRTSEQPLKHPDLLMEGGFNFKRNEDYLAAYQLTLDLEPDRSWNGISGTDIKKTLDRAYVRGMGSQPPEIIPRTSSKLKFWRS